MSLFIFKIAASQQSKHNLIMIVSPHVMLSQNLTKIESRLRKRKKLEQVELTIVTRST